MEQKEKNILRLSAAEYLPVFTVAQIVSVVRNFRITAMARLHAGTEFEKFRVVQDELCPSDFDRFLLENSEEVLE